MGQSAARRADDDGELRWGSRMRNAVSVLTVGWAGDAIRVSEPGGAGAA